MFFDNIHDKKTPIFLNQIGWINFVILTLTVERIRAVFVAKKNEKFCTICTWLYLTDLLGTKEHTSTKVHVQVQVHPWYTYVVKNG